MNMNLQEYIKQKEDEANTVFANLDPTEIDFITSFHSKTIKGILEQVEKICEKMKKDPKEFQRFKNDMLHPVPSYMSGYNSALSTLLQQLSEVKKNI